MIKGTIVSYISPIAYCLMNSLMDVCSMSVETYSSSNPFEYVTQKGKKIKTETLLLFLLKKGNNDKTLGNVTNYVIYDP